MIKPNYIQNKIFQVLFLIYSISIIDKVPIPEKNSKLQMTSTSQYNYDKSFIADRSSSLAQDQKLAKRRYHLKKLDTSSKIAAWFLLCI